MMDRRLVKNRLIELIKIMSKDSNSIPYIHHKQIIKLFYNRKQSMDMVTHWIFDQYAPPAHIIKSFFANLDKKGVYSSLLPNTNADSFSTSLTYRVFECVAQVENSNPEQHEIDTDLAIWILKRLVFQSSHNDGGHNESLILTYRDILKADLKPPNRDFIPYPEISDRHFQRKILRKSEFAKFKYPEIQVDAPQNNQCNKAIFERTLNQNFLRNFMSPMTPYNGVLLYHGVGVGKSCSAISIAEQFHSIFEKKTLILMPSGLKENFKKQIFDLDNPNNSCTGKTYYSSANYTALNRELVEKKINRHIQTKYDMKGFMEFANYIGKMKVYEGTTKEIPLTEYKNLVREECSNRVIIIDEVHNVREGDGDKIVPPILNDVFKYAENVKLILLSATPMYNDATEIIDVVNLLLLNDKKEPILIENVFEEDKSDKVAYMSQLKTLKLLDNAEQVLGGAIKGYISYMRSENPYTFPMRLYPTQSTLLTIKDFPLVECVMSDHQKQSYAIAEDANDKKKSDNAQRFQVSNIAYPNHQGTTGFNEVFEVDKNQSVTYKNKNNQILDHVNLKKYSAKMDFVVNSILESKGIVFVYSFYLHAGIIPLAIALEHRGFQNINTNILKNGNISDATKSKSKNYCIISPQNKNVNANIDTLKSQENMDGSKIKVVLGSSIATEGFDFKNIREIYILDPWWNLNRIEQIIGRAVRHCSHIALPAAERNVTIYNMACKDTIDIRAYITAAKKQKNIDQVEQIIKKYAIDCNLNSTVMYYDPDILNHPMTITDSKGVKRDVKLGDTRDKFLPVKCIHKGKNVDVDISTDNKYFYRDDLEKITFKISEMYNAAFEYSFIEIKKELANFDHNNIAYALNEMITNKVPIRNDSSGFLIYRADKYIYQPFYSDNLGLPLAQRAKHTKMQINVIKLTKPEREHIDADSILGKITDDINALGVVFKKNSKEFTNVIIDYYADRLLTEDVLTLVKYHIQQKDDVSKMFKSIIKSLIEGHRIVKTDEHTYIRDVYDTQILMVNNTTGESEIADDFVIRYGDLELKPNIKPSDVHGFIDTLSKDGEIIYSFKVLNKNKPNSTGTICKGTSTLTKDILIDYIQQIDPNIEPDPSRSKNILCDMYELILRKNTLLSRPTETRLMFSAVDDTKKPKAKAKPKPKEKPKK